MTFHIGYLKFIKVEELTEEERDDLVGQLQEHKASIEAALKSVDADLKTLAKPKRAPRGRKPSS